MFRTTTARSSHPAPPRHAPTYRSGRPPYVSCSPGTHVYLSAGRTFTGTAETSVVCTVFGEGAGDRGAVSVAGVTRGDIRTVKGKGWTPLDPVKKE